ncbi:MAG: phosphohydrolase [Caulobacteraceae bacterium]|nr:phosphohydrolase [Caulobacteraceae bacterium]
MADGEHSGEARAKFHAMVDGSQDDWMIIAQAIGPFGQELPKRILAHLNLLEGDCGGFAIDRLQHSLQTATRAHRDGRDEEYVVCALLHDIGDTLGPKNHADVAAAIVKPFVSEQNHWMVEQHAVFQGYYFFDYLGLDRNMRDQFKGHPAYEYTAQFCHLYDQNSFDPNFDTMPIEAFEPMLHRVLTTVKRSIYQGMAGAP